MQINLELKILRSLILASALVITVGWSKPAVFSPFGPTRDESTPWAEWQKSSVRETDNNGYVFMGHQHHGVPHSIQKSQNGNIYRFEVRQGEGRDADRAHNNDRAELGGVPRHPYGRDIWVAYSLKVKSTPRLHEHERVVISQFHGHAGSPAMSVRLNHGKLGLQTLSDTALDSSGRALKTDHLTREIEPDRWHNLVIRANFGTEERALLQVWLNGELIHDRTHFNMGYKTGKEVYWKFGVYRNSHPGTHILEFANMEIAESSLEARVKSPKEIVP